MAKRDLPGGRRAATGALVFVAAAWMGLIGNSASSAVSVRSVRPMDADVTYHGIYVRANGSVGALVGEQVFEDAKATIAVTRDKGKTWDVRRGVANGRLLAVFFVDDVNGWAVGENGTVLATANAGQTWTSQTSKVLTDLYDVFFLTPRRGWAVGLNSTVVSTADGGRTWQVLGGGRPSGEVGEGEVAYTGVHFVNENVGFLSAAVLSTMVTENGIIQQTTDGGKTWKPVHRVVESLSSLTFADAQRGWGVGKGGSIVATSDGGKTWAAQNARTEEDLLRVSAGDASHVWVTGEYGTVAYTQDGGKTWVPVAVPGEAGNRQKTLTDKMSGVSAFGNEAWVMSDFGKVFYFVVR